MHQYQPPHKQTLTQPLEQKNSSLSGQQPAREILLLCVTANISPSQKERLSQILAGAVDWKYLLDLAEFHGVAPLIAHNLVANGLSSQVPQPYLERLSQIYNGTLYRNVILSNEVTKVLSVFSQHGIAAIILKGIILAEQLYGNPGLRTVADMDILVQPEEVSLAGSLLLEMGYQQPVPKQAWNHPFHEAPYYKQGQFPFFIELHWDLDNSKLVAIPKEEIWRRAQFLQLQGGSTMVLSAEDNLLFLANHLFKHHTHLLKFLGDIAELLKKYDGVLDWDYIIESARSWQIEAAVHYSLKRAKDLLEAPVPVSPVRALKPSIWRRWVLDFLVSQETFVSPIRSDKLRIETSALVHSLMRKHTRQMLAVLARHRGSEKRAKWLRTAIWIMLVFGAALGRNTARFLSGWR
jgi:hypothetical protein